MFAKCRGYLMVLFTVGFLCLEYTEAGTYSDLQRLHNHLSPYMDTNIRPVLNQSHTVLVDLQPYLIAVHGLEEKAQVLSSTLGIRLAWKYETLTWNSSQFGGTKSIEVSSNSIWTPDITYNNAFREKIELTKRASVKVTIAESGQADWHTGANLETSCSVDIRKYPFDTQTCKIVLGKMIYHDYQQTVTSVGNKIYTSTTEENNEWIIVDTNIKYMVQERTHNSVTFIELVIVLERRNLFYVLNFIIPVIMLSMMTIFSFKLPSTSGERIGYGISLLLTYVVLLNTISDSVPKVSKSVSYLQLYIIIQFALAIIISILSILSVRMTDSNYEFKIPKFVYSMYNLFQNYEECKRKTKQAKTRNKINTHENVEDKSKERRATDQILHQGTGEELDIARIPTEMLGKTANMDDMKVVQFLDSLGFWVFMSMFVISTITCLLSMAL